MPHTQYPLILLRSIAKNYTKIRSTVEENSDVLEISETADWKILITTNVGSNFFFEISNPNMQATNNLICRIKQAPKDFVTPDASSYDCSLDGILNQIISWLALIREYDEIIITPFDKISEHYRKFYTSKIEILDEDADNVPFELDKQLLIETFLDDSIRLFEQDESSNSDLIAEATELKESIQSKTKKAVMERIAVLFGKVHQKSLPLLKDFITEAKKTIFKNLVEFGINKMHELMTGIHHM